mgnify:CR=1 FL=1
MKSVAKYLLLTSRSVGIENMIVGIQLDGLGVARNGSIELLGLQVLVALVLVLSSTHICKKSVMRIYYYKEIRITKSYF